MRIVASVAFVASSRLGLLTTGAAMADTLLLAAGQVARLASSSSARPTPSAGARRPLVGVL